MRGSLTTGDTGSQRPQLMDSWGKGVFGMLLTTFPHKLSLLEFIEDYSPLEEYNGFQSNIDKSFLCSKYADFSPNQYQGPVRLTPSRLLAPKHGMPFILPAFCCSKNRRWEVKLMNSTRRWVQKRYKYKTTLSVLFSSAFFCVTVKIVTPQDIWINVKRLILTTKRAGKKGNERAEDEEGTSTICKFCPY